MSLITVQKLLPTTLLVKVVAQIQQLTTKLDGYHRSVQEGLTADLTTVVEEMRAERLVVRREHESEVRSLHTDVARLERTVLTLQIHSQRYLGETQELESEKRRVCLALETLERQKIVLDCRVTDLRERAENLEAACTDLRHTNATLLAQAEASLSVRESLRRLTAENRRLEEGQDRIQRQKVEMEAEWKRCEVELPGLREKARWFDHFLPTIDVQELRSNLPTTVGHAQEVATLQLLRYLFRGQFYSIELVSNSGHRGDIRIQPESQGPAVLVEVKSHLPLSKGTLTKTGIRHTIASRDGREKILEDLALNRFEGCLSGIMVILPSHSIPNIVMQSDRVNVDPEHPNLFYSYSQDDSLRKTVLAAILYAYALWGQRKASSAYQEQIQARSLLLGTSNEDVLQMYTSIQGHLDVYGKQHRQHTSTAAAIGLNLRSMTKKASKRKRTQG